MNASVFALLCVAVFASNLRQQTFLAPFEGGIEAITEALTSQVEQLEGFFISKLYPDNADQVQAELQACQDQAVESLPTVIKGVVGDIKGLVQACASGSVTDAANKILQDAMVVLQGVSAGCPNMTVNIGADIEQLFATLIVQTLEGLKSPQVAQQQLQGLAAQVQEGLEQQAQQFVSQLPEQIQQLFGQIAGQMKAASGQVQQIQEGLKAAAGPIIAQVKEVITPIVEQAQQVGAQLGKQAQQVGAQLQAQAAGIEQEVAQIGGKLAVAAGVDEDTLQKTGEDAKTAMSAIQQVLAAVQAGNLTPDQLVAALNSSLALVSDSGAAFADVASGGAEKATEIASTMCGLISPVLSQIQGKVEEVKANRQQ